MTQSVLVAISGLLVSGALAVLSVPQEVPEAFRGGRAIPKERIPDAVLTDKRCSSCHTMKRVTRARWQGDEWADVVEIMKEKEKSGISTKDAGRISRFLAWWSGGEADGREPPADPPAAAGPVALGGPGVFAAPIHAVVAEATVPGAATLPHAVDLGGTTVTVTRLDVTVGPTGVSAVTAALEVGDDTATSRLARADTGVEVSGAPVRRWRIGSFAFRQAVHVYETGSPPATGRPEVRLAMIVVRENWKRVDIGWRPVRPKADRPAPVRPAPKDAKPPPKCPFGDG